MAADDAFIQLVTRCSSEEEFIERFARFATETDLVVPAQPDVSVGTDGHFAICLQDRSVIMRGRCEITEIWPLAAAAAATSVRALMRLRLREMDAHSCGIHLRLMERHGAEHASTGAVVAVPAAPSETEPTEISPAPHPETRAPGAAFTLPANPLGELGAADLASFIELTLFESNAGVDAAAAAGAEPAPDGVTPAVARAVRLAARLDRAARIARRVGPYVACAVIGLVLGIALRSAAGTPSVAEAPAPPPVPVASAVAPPSEPTPTTTADPEPSAVVAARSSRAPAKVVVTSFPRRAIITLNDRSLGRAPRTISTQRYEQLRIEASLPGYQSWNKTIVVKQARSTVAIKLVRLPKPTAQPATAASSPLARLP